MDVVLGRAASTRLDKNIDPLDCKVINRLIESRVSSSTDRMLPLSFSSPWMLLKQSYRENCTSRVLARAGQLPSLLVMGGALPRTAQLSVAVRLFIPVKAGSYSKRSDRGTWPIF